VILFIFIYNRIETNYVITEEPDPKSKIKIYISKLSLSNDSKIAYLQTIIFCCNNAAKNMKYSFYENQHYPMLDRE
jgi:hypothetical protein